MLLLVVDVMDINHSTIWKLFSFLFSPAFPLFSQPLAMDTLPSIFAESEVENMASSTTSAMPLLLSTMNKFFTIKSTPKWVCIQGN